MRTLLVACLLLPCAAWAQQPAASGPATLAALVCQNLSNALADGDALRAQIADLQKQLADAKPK